MAEIAHRDQLGAVEGADGIFVIRGGDTQLPFAGGTFSDGNNRPFDPRPAAGTFSPVQKGRVLGVELGAAF